MGLWKMGVKEEKDQTRYVRYDASLAFGGQPSRAITLFLLLVPFFEPLCFGYFKSSLELEAIGSGFSSFFTVYRICAVVVILLALVPKVRLDYALGFIVLIGFFLVLSVLVENSDALAKTGFEALTYLSLCVFLHYEWCRHPDALIRACVCFFSIYTVLSIASVVFTGANGFMNTAKGTPTAAGAIFFFGGKNSIFMYNLPTLLFVGIYRYRNYGTLGYLPAFIALALCITSSVIDSASSTFFFLIICIFCLFAQNKKTSSFARLLSKPTLLLCLFLLIFITIVVMGAQFDVVSGLLSFFGRSATFTGRTSIWQQAVEHIVESPLFGGGGSLSYVVAGTIRTTHAHSFYLNAFAQYGVFYFAMLIIDMVAACALANRRRPSFDPVDCLCVFLFFCLAIHSEFDFLFFPIYLILRSCIVDRMRAEKPSNVAKDG